MTPPPPGSLSALLIEGQKAYAEEKYDVAVRAFTRALEASKEDAKSERVHIWDLRVAAYLRLGRFDLAWKDANRMIRHDRTDGRGYLRSGQVECLHENYAAAIKWYEQGLKHVPASTRPYASIEKQLRKTRCRLTEQIVSSRPTDPLTALPTEMVEFVLSYLDYKQHVALLRVSKTWNQTICRLRPLCDTLDFRGSNEKITCHMLSASLKRLSKWPRTAILCNMTEAAARSIGSHLDRWVNWRTLQHLEVNDAKLSLTSLCFDKFSLKTIIVGPHSQIEPQHVHSILRTCRSLEIARFRNILPSPHLRDPKWENNVHHERLEVLELRSQRDILGFLIRTDFFQGFPGLRELTCHSVRIHCDAETTDSLDLTHMTNLEQLDLSQSTVPYCIIPPPTLHKLILENATLVPFKVQGPGKMVEPLSNLRVLRMYGCRDYPPMLYQIRGPNKEGVLTELSIDVDALDSSHFVHLMTSVGWMKQLQHLRLKLQALNDMHSQLFIEGCPHLKTLVLENALITGVFVVDLLTAPSSQIALLVLKDCVKVSLDTIDWARNRGVHVEVRNSTQALGGRIVRHYE